MEGPDWSLSREWSSVHSPFLAALHLYSPPFAIQIFYNIIACFMFLLLICFSIHSFKLILHFWQSRPTLIKMKLFIVCAKIIFEKEEDALKACEMISMRCCRSSALDWPQ